MWRPLRVTIGGAVLCDTAGATGCCVVDVTGGGDDGDDGGGWYIHLVVYDDRRLHRNSYVTRRVSAGRAIVEIDLVWPMWWQHFRYVCFTPFRQTIVILYAYGLADGRRLSLSRSTIVVHSLIVYLSLRPTTISLCVSLSYPAVYWPLVYVYASWYHVKLPILSTVYFKTISEYTNIIHNKYTSTLRLSHGLN